MRLEDALKRIGAEVVKSKVDKTQAIIFLRVNIEYGPKWVDAISNLLLSLNGKPFTMDISKSFFASGGEVKYLWRVVIDGEVAEAFLHWSSCILQAHMNHAPEITSMPLIGRVTYPFDPSKGLIKGGHPMESSLGILNVAIGGGGVS